MGASLCNGPPHKLLPLEGRAFLLGKTDDEAERFMRRLNRWGTILTGDLDFLGVSVSPRRGRPNEPPASFLSCRHSGQSLLPQSGLMLESSVFSLAVFSKGCRSRRGGPMCPPCPILFRRFRARATPSSFARRPR